MLDHNDDPTNPSSKLSVLEDTITPHHCGLLNRKQARQSGNLEDLHAFRRDAKVSQILTVMNNEGLSLANFIEGIFVSDDPSISRYGNHFFDHSHFCHAMDAIFNREMKTIDEWIVDAAAQVVSHQMRTLHSK
jgi:hypothetical protein